MFILIGAVVLSLPAASASGSRLPLIDSLFTSTSAICVTGLTVVDTGGTFSGLGEWVILLLFQAGGLGIMTFSTFFAVLMGRKIGFSETDTIKGSMDRNSVYGLERLLYYILGLTIAIEAAGTAALFFRWKAVSSWTAGESLRQALFHSVSGFCNAGFSLFKDSLTGYRADPVVNFTMMSLIVLGGLGFVVLMEIAGLFVKKHPARRLSLQSKIAITTSAILIAAGALLIFFLEKGNTLKNLGTGEGLMASAFHSVAARTAGFNTLPVSSMSMPTQMVIMFLMFVGASPGSTGGGIKTCTLAVIAASVYCILKDRKKTSLLGRSITSQIVREATVIIFLALAWVFAATTLLAFLERNNPAVGGNFMNVFFEVVSAFGTVGLSTGITSSLSWGGKLCIIATMFAGRIGPLTLALAVAFKDKSERYFYPEENIMVG
ncbi:MAG TPA: potassium transporter TrkG [Candidatus Omnitrophota bacterium]|nr:potassium transporter TrkG [Candidatus Omnitrophota bacterium]